MSVPGFEPEDDTYFYQSNALFRKKNSSNEPDPASLPHQSNANSDPEDVENNEHISKLNQ